MPTPRTRMSTEARRGQLIRVAATLFGTRAFEDVWVDDVAAAAGVSRPLIYHYFPTKRDLFIEVVKLHFEELRSASEPDPALPPADQLNASISGYLAYVDSHADGYRAIHQAAYGSEETRQLIDARYDELAANVREGAREVIGDLVDLPLVVLAIRGWLGFLRFTALEWLERQTVSSDDVLVLLQTTLFGAIAQAIARSQETDDATSAS